MVAARTGDETVKSQLAPRFQEAIDEAAMRLGDTGADDYLAGWERSPWTESAGTPAEVLDQIGASPRVYLPGVRWTTRDQWHVTLRFLGSADVDAVTAALRGLRHPPVEAVVVGDAPLDEGGRALVQACREAATNAAVHSGADKVDVYLEAGPAALTAFVRDRGRGFEPSAVPADRRGLAESVHGRMQRAGGTAVVHSSPGDGTEVELAVAR